MLPFLVSIKGGSHENDMLFEVTSMVLKFCGSPDSAMNTINKKTFNIFIQKHKLGFQ